MEVAKEKRELEIRCNFADDGDDLVATMGNSSWTILSATNRGT